MRDGALSLVNAGALGVALLVSAALSAVVAPSMPTGTDGGPLAEAASSGEAQVSATPRAVPRTTSPLGPGAPAAPEPAAPDAALTDASGRSFVSRDYRRIASGSIVADRLLLELVEPNRVVAVSGQSRATPDAYRFGATETIRSLDRTESLLAMKPDLLLIHALGDRARIDALRSVGLPVFDLGPLVGVESVVRTARALGALTGRAERAEEIVERFLRSLREVARDVPPSERRRGLYLASYGDQIFGGTRGTSFGEVLDYAGLVDIAPPGARGWPRYTVEQLLSIDPDIVVTQRGMGDVLCRRPELHALRACRERTLLVEVAPAVIEDPGLGMLDAAERIFRAVYAR